MTQRKTTKERNVGAVRPTKIRAGWAPVEQMIVLQFVIGEEVVSIALEPRTAAALVSQITASLNDGDSVPGDGPIQ